MPLIHQRVLENRTRHIQDNLDHFDLLNRWAKNLQLGIFDSESQSEGEFKQQILINVLGYVGSSNGQKWTVVESQRIGSGAVDLALGNFSPKSSQIIAPFELKGAKTGLDAIMPGRHKTPVQQAWEYANAVDGAKWVLVSNYREIRLYANGKGNKNYESFDLSKPATREHYVRLIALLSPENLLGGQTASLLEESDKVEKTVTNDLYEEYKAIRVRLIEDITKNNSHRDKLDVIRHAQTILDRILFVAFAEDRQLLPEKTLEKAFTSTNHFNPAPIWENFKGLFAAINTGSKHLNIPCYNGGLFAEDTDLNALKIGDEICRGFKKIGEYDFNSEISVNILGHIFEQSISDLEELKAHARGEQYTSNKKTSKRKKDGIVYTPPYITQYIVEQAVGGYLAEKRREIGFDSLPELSEADNDSIKTIKTGKRKGQVDYNENIAKHVAAWEAYKEALSSIKVLDPACGSGAFLNEVFDYLHREGQAINHELARFQGSQTSLFRWDTYILTHNLYGVDINDESVEITKLSLWLKTANKKEKLASLDNNIQVGNSLIDDPAIAGDLAFDWNKKFPDIMQAGGFDVVVGNPPYGADMDHFAAAYEKLYPNTSQGFKEIYKYFFDQSVNHLLKPGGLLGFITPNTFFRQPRYADLRRVLLQFSIRELIELGENVFEEAVPTAITILSKGEKGITRFADLSKSKNIVDDISNLRFTTLDQSLFHTTPNNIFIAHFREKQTKEFLLGDILDMKDAGFKYQRSKVGMSAKGGNDLADRIFYDGKQVDAADIPILTGKEINEFHFCDSPKKYLRGNYATLLRANEITYFNPAVMNASEKLIWRQTAPFFIGTVLDKPIFFGNTIQAGIIKDEFRDNVSYRYLCGLLNSSYLRQLYENNVKETGRVFPQVKLEKMRPLPIVIAEDQRPVTDLVDKMLSLKKDLFEKCRSFLNRVSDNLMAPKMTTPLKHFYNLEFGEFCAELAKQKRRLSLNEQDEWEEYFVRYQSDCQSLSVQIASNYAEIDRLVFDFYELTSEKIALVEGG